MNNLNNLIVNQNNTNFPPREIILRSIQKDREYIDSFNKHILALIDSLIYFLPLNFHSEKAEIFSKLMFYFTNYIFRRGNTINNSTKISQNVNTTPGEEYTSIYKHLQNK